MNRKLIFLLVSALLLGFVGGLLGGASFSYFDRTARQSPALQLSQVSYSQGRSPNSLPENTGPNSPTGFEAAAATGTASVVFIKTVSNASPAANDNFWFWGFGGNRGPVTKAGSGVILTQSGYIVTNNHVVDGAERIEVALTNKHTYQAKIVGVDPSTDLALLKIEADGLTPIVLGNSDGVQIGDWALAVGNPFNLTYTVTAGIISAKGRNININTSQFPIESFIQTDAAINPGNSGGALINTKGELIGINTAIASETGAYNGYGFAIPVNIVRKVVADLTAHGEVQQAFTGAEVEDIDAAIGKRLSTNDFTGVYLAAVDQGGAAAKVGLTQGDVILAIDDYPVNSKAIFLERISYHSPGDRIKIRYRRGGKEQTVELLLENRDGTTGLTHTEHYSNPALGADVEPLSKVERQKYGVSGGYRLSNIKRGRVAEMNLPEGFIILKVNRYVPETVNELVKLLQQSRGSIIIEGIQSDGSRATYQFYSY